MSIPAITRVTPTVAPTAGRLLVEVEGEGFRLPAPPPASGPAGRLPTTVAVRFGRRAARDVRVYSAQRLTCLAPVGDEGASDVVVENLDDDGVPIAGERATLPGAFVYQRPSLAVEADLTRVVRTLLQELKREIVPHVVLTVHTDVQEDTGATLHLASVAQLPALVLMGPELEPDRAYATNASLELPDGDGGYVTYPPPYTVDLSFAILGIASHTTELLNLLALTQLYLHRTTYLEMPRDAADAAAGVVRYELAVARDGALKVATAPNESNLRSFSGRLLIRGFDLEAITEFAVESVVARGDSTDDVVLARPAPMPDLP